MKRVIDVATAELGYKEQGNNITKYSKDFDDNHPDFYNTKKQGAEWCDIFVDWCMVKAYGEDLAHALLCQPKKSAGAGCIYSYAYYKAKGQVGRVPRVGAQAFFGMNEKSLNHTGIVIGVDGSKVTTIEGNAGNEVKIRTYGPGGVFGYGYPDYTLIEAQPAPATPAPTPAPAPEPTPTPTPTKETTVMIELRQLSNGSKGADVKSLQGLLNAKINARLVIDGDFGPNTRNSVRNYQQSKGLCVDGIVGRNTWTALLNS